MKLNKKNMQSIIIFTFLGFIIGSLAWNIFELLLNQIGLNFTLTTPAIGFNLEVLSFYIKVNPGSILGSVSAVFLFKSL